MKKMAEDKKLVTQMGIQVHSFYDYKLATLLIQSGIIGKVSTVHAWSPKNWGFDGDIPKGSDPIPDHLDWNLWLGTSPKRPYKEGFYHPMDWRKILDYGCGQGNAVKQYSALCPHIDIQGYDPFYSEY
mgnify:CR=1 FL=1